MGIIGCKGLCTGSTYVLSLSEIRRKQRFIYENGVSYCSACEKYMKGDKIHCECCGHKKRFTPKGWDCRVNQFITKQIVRY